MSDKPSRNEEEYFARMEAERLKERRAAAAEAAAAAERQRSLMRCPKCGAELVTEEYHGIQVDRCPECHGVWFDAGEVEQILQQQESGGVGGLFRAIMDGVRARTAPAKSERPGE